MDYHSELPYQSPQHAPSPASSPHTPSSDPLNQAQYPTDYHVVLSQSVQYDGNSLHAPMQQYPAQYSALPSQAPSPRNTLHAPNQQYPTQYHGALPSQPMQYAPFPGNTLHALNQQYPTQYHSALPSQPVQYAPFPGNTLHAPYPPPQMTHYHSALPPSVQYAPSHGNSLQAPLFQLQSHPLPVRGNTTFTPQHFGNFTPPVAPQPLLPMTAYTPGVSSSPFVQPIVQSESSRSSESVYGTPQESFSQGPGTPQLTPTQWPQQVADLEMSGDNTPTQMADEEQSWLGESLYNTQPSRPGSTTLTQHDHNQMSQSMEDGEGYRCKVPSRTSARNGDNQTRGVPYVAQPTPGPSTTERHPRIDFQHKVHFVGNQDTEAYRGIQQQLKNERRSRREAEKGAREKQNEAAQQSETLLSTFEMEANERAQKAERARKAQELQAKKRQGTPLPLRQQPDFPDALPALTPRYAPQTTCQQCQLDTINRNAGGNLPHLRQVKRENDSADDCCNDNSSRSSSETETESEDDGVSCKGKGARKGQRARLQEILSSDKRALKGLVKELMKEMNVGGVTKSKSRRKVCCATGLDQAKKMQHDKLTKEEDSNCKTLVCELFRLSTQLNRAADFKDYRPATDDQAAHCGDPNGERPLPGVSPFYFGKGYKMCMWNDILLRGLVGDLRQKRAEDPNHWNIPDVSTDYLIALFLNSVKEGRYTWVQQQPRLGESETQVWARAEQYDKATKQAKSSRSRKDMKWKKRCRTAKKMKLLCAGDPTAVKIWAWVNKLLALLGTLGMSSEDAKPHKVRIAGRMVRQTTHVIQICPWHPETITDTLELVDFAADQISLKKGVFGCPRVRTNIVSNTLAPPGLPETLYDEQWMADGLEMDPDFMNDLNVSEEAFEIMELAFEDLGIEVVEEEAEAAEEVEEAEEEDEDEEMYD
ncbi:hypothetical protein B0H13DRAFT_1886298 [Mycena leptocephala]|nr:hypothetical protein B0H13DRAFT_1886298 [Mycena leptocephala]